MLDGCACLEKKVLGMHIPFVLAKDTSLSPFSLVCLPSPYGPTTSLTLSLTDALKSAIIISPVSLLITQSRSE